MFIFEFMKKSVSDSYVFWHAEYESGIYFTLRSMLFKLSWEKEFMILSFV